MLVTRQFDTGRNTWSSSKLEAVCRNTVSPRMSNFEPLPPQSDWREQYSAFVLPGDNGSLQPSFEQSASCSSPENDQDEQSSVRPALKHRHSLGTAEKEAQTAPINGRPESAPTRGVPTQQAGNSKRDDSLVSTSSVALSHGSNPLSSASSAPAQQEPSANNDSGEVEGDIKEEDDDLDDDDDEVLDAETEEGAAQQTAAERRAERRKMKRFR